MEFFPSVLALCVYDSNCFSQSLMSFTGLQPKHVKNMKISSNAKVYARDVTI